MFLEFFLRKDQGFELDNMTTMENEILWEQLFDKTYYSA